MAEVTTSPGASIKETAQLVILICTKCGWSLKAPLNCLEIDKNGFLCGRCFEKIVLTCADKSFSNVID